MILKYGSNGPEVLQLQKDLNKINLTFKLVEDGDFGPQTLIAVRIFQAKKNLPVDGIVGPLTHNAILDSLGMPQDPVETTTAGIDIYHGDTVLNWESVYSANIKFCFIKATEGYNYIDPSFQHNWDKCKAAGIIRGAYHFFHPAQDPIKQAIAFCSTVGTLFDNDLPMVMDWEVTDNTSPSTDEGRGLDFLLKVQQLTKRRPIIYSGPYFLNDLTLASNFAVYPLWVAHYGTNHPKIPSPWTKYTFWQTGDQGHVTGITNPCDMNQFAGSLVDLKKFIADSVIK